ncbi:MAG TPA: serine/threonine kinase [Cyanobacteria bacterium UBA11149]|nr:serine/threonine kinase [Cyanobacteria bacterium UBA11366]HBR72254.1 serine/threonine kinase [Cyanobacteria bacterium UBA11159]HBS68426.1 serine/threonine kinase [Cyanobacteria bacterium UBA11153]HBW91914.1 serine/threonine kinase [Cyanobacteria bacterium UBA11149]HCA94485.1 serine/threonine kinase [Cyanobacteria bacterium UBA9226]
MTTTKYTKLYHFLNQKDWKDADIETRQLMLQIAGADSREDRLLTANDIQQYSQRYSTIPLFRVKTNRSDRLWLQASQGHFGFSVISNLYQAVNEDYFLLADQVGWRSEKDWIDYNKINFTLDAPVGHLPITWLVPTSF